MMLSPAFVERGDKFIAQCSQTEYLLFISSIIDCVFLAQKNLSCLIISKLLVKDHTCDLKYSYHSSFFHNFANEDKVVNLIVEISFLRASMLSII